MRNDNSLASILLVSRLCSRGDPELKPLKASEYWSLRELVESRGESLGALFGQSETQLRDDHRLDDGLGCGSSARIVRLLARATAMALELERLEQSGVVALTPDDERYPSRILRRLERRVRGQLTCRAPTLLYAAGNLSLLQRPGAGVVGSRKVGIDGAKTAKAAGERIAGLGRVLVSGGARGVDQMAMDAAFQAGGGAVGVLAESLSRKLKNPDVRGAIFEDRIVLCTPYSPDAPFRVWAAMGRNKLVYALSDLTLVVASEAGKGGTWSGAVEALRHRYGPVGVWTGPGRGEGNSKLEAKDATPISSMDDLETALLGSETPRAGQEQLFPEACATIRCCES